MTMSGIVTKKRDCENFVEEVRQEVEKQEANENNGDNHDVEDNDSGLREGNCFRND